MQTEFLAKLGDLKEHIEKSLDFWKVPGLALAIVKDGEVVLAEGFGYKDLENKQPMTADTVMPIGSASKSFTAMAAAILTDAGELDWDKPVTEYIPNFKMFDPVATQQVTVRDMLCHRTGMPRHDLMWAGGTGQSFTREDLIHRVRFLENNAEFREKTQYQNHMFATVGYAVEKVSGKTWEEFVKEKIFDPLGMKNSNFSVLDSQKAPDYGLPYRHNKEGEITPAQFMELGAPGPAGSINSSVNDMANWLKLIQGKGALGETRVVSEEKLKEMQTPQVHYKILPWEFPEIQFNSCGLGWFTEVYRGHLCVHHGGNVTGFTALVSTLPDENIGFCILTNMNSTFLTYALQCELMDRILGAPKVDWNERYKTEIDKLLKAAEDGKAAVDAMRKEGTKPTHAPEAYEGVYEHPGYGTLTVSKGDAPEGFVVDFNGNKLRLEHFHYNHYKLMLDTFSAELPSHFSIGLAGDIESLSVPFEGAIGKDIVFKRKAEEESEAEQTEEKK